MRILYITDALAIWGGIERILVEKANFLADNCGYDVCLVTVNQGSHPILFPISDKVNYIDFDIRFHQQYSFRGFPRLIKRWQLKRLYINRLRNYVTLNRPDIIISARVELLYGIAAVKGDIPLLFESHSSYIAFRFLSDNWFSKLKAVLLCRNARHADVVVTLTEGDAEEWRKITSKVCVIPNMVHLNNSGKYSTCTNKSVIFVGRFTRQKDICSLLKIWSIINQLHPDWCLQIYGDSGEEKESIIKKIKKMNANIEINKPVSNIFEKYCENSILIMTSIFEPFGLVLPEAMSCGLPVVAFDCPYGPCDIIQDGVDGFVIPNRDINAFAERVCLLMDDYSLRVKMGKEGIKSSSRYQDIKIMPKWIQLFQSLRV